MVRTETRVVLVGEHEATACLWRRDRHRVKCYGDEGEGKKVNRKDRVGKRGARG